jgi:uncharacterized membrane protein
MRAIVGGSICIVVMLLAYAFTRNRLKNKAIFYICIVSCVVVVSLILLSEAVQSIIYLGIAT